MSLPTCPGRQELKLYMVGKLDEERSQEIDTHVVVCTDCQALLETIGDSNDTLINSLKQPVEENEYLKEPECQEALALIEAIGRDPTLAGSAAADDAAADEAGLGQIRDYKLLAKLGEGGMGAVYKALHLHLNKVVALKLLPKEQTGDSQSVARFRREMVAVGALEHPNIVGAHDAGEHDGRHFLVMEYVKGQDLSQLSRQLGPLPVAEACELVRQAAVGLQHAHEHGLVHRDIKPSNLMLSQDGRVKILDMGLALLDHANSGRQGLTDTGRIMGTLDYMAPEQCTDSHRVDIRADVYSLGATLYRLLSGQAPFGAPDRNNAIQKLLAISHTAPKPLKDFRTDIPDDLEWLIAQTLAKDPSHRPPTPADLASALESFAVGSDIDKLLDDATNQPTSDDAVVKPGISTFDFLSSPMTGTHPGHPPGTTPAPNRTESPALAGRGRQRWAMLVVSLVLLLLVGGGAAVYSIRYVSAKGVIVIRADDARVGITLKDKTVIVRDRTSDRRYELQLGENEIDPGDYEIIVRELPDGIHFSTTRFEIVRRGSVSLAAFFEPNSPGPVTFSAASRLPGTRSLKLPNPAPPNTCYTVAFDPTSKRFATGAADGKLRIWNSEDGKLLTIIPAHDAQIRDVRWSPDGKRLVSVSQDGVCRAWDADAWIVADEIAKHDGEGYWGADWSHGGDAVAFCGTDLHIWLWDSRQKSMLNPLDGHAKHVHSVAFSPDGQQLVSGADDLLVKIWDVKTGHLKQSLSGHPHGIVSVAISPNGLVCASGDYGGECRIWRVSDGELLHTIDAHALDKLGRRVIFRVVFSSDSKILATAGADNTVRFWDVDQGKLVQIWNPGIGYVWGLDWSNDGTKIIAAGVGGGEAPALHQLESLAGQPLSAVLLENRLR